MYEIYRKKGMEKEDAKQICDILERNKETWVEIMMVEELGLLPIEENPMKNGFVTFCSFALFGFVPIIPFVVSYIAHSGGTTVLFIVSTVMTGVFLIILGVLKSMFSYAKWYASGFETLLIGSISAVVSYLVGLAFEGI